MRAEKVKASRLLSIAKPKMASDLEKEAQWRVRNSVMEEMICFMRMKYGYGKKRLHRFMMEYGFFIDDLMHEKPKPTAAEFAELLMDECKFDVNAEFEMLNRELAKRNEWRKNPRGMHE